jgi:glycosyltransferase involved in cell wall biosynthesis
MAVRNVLFIHRNFPAQFRHIAAFLARDARYRVFAFGSDTARPIAGVKLYRYAVPPDAEASAALAHPFSRRFDMECWRAEQVMYLAHQLKAEGVSPDVVFVHPGWGEALPLRVLFPGARISVFCEFYYRAAGADVGFDQEFPQLGIDGLVRVHLRNAASLLSLTDADVGVAPTLWQRSGFPPALHSKIEVIHDGIDVAEVRPDETASIILPSGRRLRAGDEVVTFVSRNLEPYRGYHIFMRALPAILRARPNAQVLVVGGSEVSYGAQPPPGRSWAQIFRDEIAGRIDAGAVHFLGTLARADYLKILQISMAHVYLTYPFVLSWSMLEAMAAGCLVVGSDTPPVTEVIEHRVTGLLVPFFSPDALAETVVAALSRPRDHQALRHRARELVRERYALQNVVLPAHHALVERLAWGAASRGPATGSLDRL